MRLHFLLIWFLAFSAPVAAMTYAEKIEVCPGSAAAPDFASPDCETMDYWMVDPQGREIWARAMIIADADLVSGAKPAGVFVSGKTASEVFLNGLRLGANGAPAARKADETPGRMDAVFFAPPEALRDGENEIVLRLSAHHGFLRFNYPLHFIALGEYVDPTQRLLDAYWPSFIPFGALVAGALFFGAAMTSGRRGETALLALLSLFAAGQLFVEIYRGLTPYLYPVHEWRMLMVVACSAGFALTLAAYMTARFVERRRALVFGAASLAVLAAVILMRGYDGKAGMAVLAAAAFSAGLAAHAAFKGERAARIYAAALSLFALSIIAFPQRFLDTIFFYELAGLLLVLFVMQAIARERDREALAAERAKGRQLEAALERAAPPENASIRISGAGAIDIVQTADIVFCKGAGDYVELALRDGRTLLHNGALARLEEDMPAGFLRVHRSYIVNTDFVRTLTRDASGVGLLTLTTGAEVPVSRRIMPKVRSALA